MKQNNTVTAPQCDDVREVFDLWCVGHSGTWSDFYRFWTRPSAERDAFLESLKLTVEYAGSVAITRYETFR